MKKGTWREFDAFSTPVKPSSTSNFHNKSQLVVRVQRTKVGKRGKTVTIISGLELQLEEAKSFLKKLKSLCGTGGAYKNDLIELQGDQVLVVLGFLKQEGYFPKQSGG